MYKCPQCGRDMLSPGESYAGDTFGFCQGHPSTGTVYPNGLPTFGRIPTPWICPVCGRANAPHCEWCDHAKEKSNGKEDHATP